MSDQLSGLTDEQRRELQTLLKRLSDLWAELTRAAAGEDQVRVDEIRREIAAHRARVEAMKRTGTLGSA